LLFAASSCLFMEAMSVSFTRTTCSSITISIFSQMVPFTYANGGIAAANANAIRQTHEHADCGNQLQHTSKKFLTLKQPGVVRWCHPGATCKRKCLHSCNSRYCNWPDT
jgi:hypothetical protein